jgi:hypothetical protein
MTIWNRCQTKRTTLFLSKMIDTSKLPITYLLNLIKQWEQDYHVDKTGDIIFQNKEFLLNVRFTNGSLNQVKKNPRGLEHLPDAISKPYEIWGRWDNVKDQQVVLMNYILSDESHIFVAQTKSGNIINTAIDTIGNIDKYRTGILFIK